MRMMKVLTCILGVLLVIGGFFCIFNPGSTYSTLAWIIGFCMLISAIGDICTYSDRKAKGMADGWSLAGAIISAVFGIILLISNGMQFALNTIIAILAGVWILASGIVKIISAVKLHKFRQTLPEERRGSVWLITLIIGILMALAGIIGFINPAVMALTIGMLMGIYILMTGVELIAVSFA